MPLRQDGVSQPRRFTMPSLRTRRLLLAFAVTLLAACTTTPPPSSSAPTTDCTAIGICYCINPGFKPVIDAQVAKLRGIIEAERAKGKAVGYLSIPLSTLGGGYFNVNREVGEKTKQRIEARLGAASAWVLNPAMPEASIADVAGVRAGGAEYMAMWTRVLEGPRGLGEDFDFIHYAGPSDFAAYFGLSGVADLDRLAAYFDARVKTDAELQRAVAQGRVTPASFRNYYGLRASVSFSLGAHDEWNIAGRINARRRADAAYGTGNQLPLWFDARAVSGAEAELATSGGYAGSCKAP
jgi:hypothetical protein